MLLSLMNTDCSHSYLKICLVNSNECYAWKGNKWGWSNCHWSVVNIVRNISWLIMCLKAKEMRLASEWNKHELNDSSTLKDTSRWVTTYQSHKRPGHWQKNWPKEVSSWPKWVWEAAQLPYSICTLTYETGSMKGKWNICKRECPMYCCRYRSKDSLLGIIIIN